MDCSIMGCKCYSHFTDSHTDTRPDIHSCFTHSDSFNLWLWAQASDSEWSTRIEVRMNYHGVSLSMCLLIPLPARQVLWQHNDVHKRREKKYKGLNNSYFEGERYINKERKCIQKLQICYLGARVCKRNKKKNPHQMCHLNDDMVLLAISWGRLVFPQTILFSMRQIPKVTS